MTVLATAGLVTATVYSLWMIHVSFFGINKESWKIPDFSLREMSAMAVMIVSLVLLGLYPQPFLDAAATSIDKLQKISARETAVVVRETDTGLQTADQRMPVERNRL